MFISLLGFLAHGKGELACIVGTLRGVGKTAPMAARHFQVMVKNAGALPERYVGEPRKEHLHRSLPIACSAIITEQLKIYYSYIA